MTEVMKEEDGDKTRQDKTRQDKTEQAITWMIF